MIKPYKEYKEIGFKLIHEIPNSWNFISLKYLLRKSNGAIRTGPFGSQLKSTDFVTSGFKVYSQRNVLDNNFENGEIYISEKKFNTLRSFEVIPGDIVITTRGTIGKCAIFPYQSEKGVLHPCLIRIQLDNNLILTEYMAILINDSNLFMNNVYYNSNATTIDVIYSDTLRKLQLPLPSIAEQKAIIRYIDHKTNLIDTLIEKKQKQIGLLKEQRAAIINQAVTKGLDPNAKMKDSGIEWLGDIPEHWSAPRLKYVCTLIKDGTHLPPPRHSEGIPLLSVRNIVNGKFINLPDDSLISYEDYKKLTKSYEVLENDVLLAIVGATIGKVAIVKKMPPFTIQRSLGLFRPFQKKLHYKFLSYFVQSDKFQNLLWMNVGYSAQPGIYLGALANFHCPLPKVTEQRIIISELDKASLRIDKSIGRCLHTIELLKEYRNTLISEVVTGKIDVRDEVIT